MPVSATIRKHRENPPDYGVWNNLSPPTVAVVNVTAFSATADASRNAHYMYIYIYIEHVFDKLINMTLFMHF